MLVRRLDLDQALLDGNARRGFLGESRPQLRLAAGTAPRRCDALGFPFLLRGLIRRDRVRRLPLERCRVGQRTIVLRAGTT